MNWLNKLYTYILQVSGEHTLTGIKNYIFLVCVLVCSCSEIQNQTEVNISAQKIALQLALPALEKVFLTESPVLPAATKKFSKVDQLPGTPFNPNLKQKQQIEYDGRGNLVLNSGDYIIPVMTYCMKNSGSSPNGQTYSLGSLVGSRAKIIRELNLRAAPQFSPNDIQILSWSLQAGLSYEEMTPASQSIINKILPDKKSELKDSVYERFAESWNKASIESSGFIPNFESASDDLINELGEVGTKIEEMRRFRKLLHDAGGDYKALRSLIVMPNNKTKKSQKTKWSKISDRIYARFLISGHFQEVGEIQIRVLPIGQKRTVNSANNESVIVDIGSWVADPEDQYIQPLSFSPIFGYAGVLVAPVLTDVPALGAIVMGTILAAKVIDWDSYFKLTDILGGTKNSDVSKIINDGIQVLNSKHDEMDKPIRDSRVVDRKMRVNESNEDRKTRQYIKKGGREQLEKDFQKIPGKEGVADDGTEYKILDNGNKIIKRVVVKEGELPTLEIQLPKGFDKNLNKLRVKVRYEP